MRIRRAKLVNDGRMCNDVTCHLSGRLNSKAQKKLAPFARWCDEMEEEEKRQNTNVSKDEIVFCYTFTVFLLLLVFFMRMLDAPASLERQRFCGLYDSEQVNRAEKAPPFSI